MVANLYKFDACLDYRPSFKVAMGTQRNLERERQTERGRETD